MKKHQEALQVWLKTQGTSVDARLAGKEITAIYELTVEIAEVAKEITTLVSAAVPTLLAMPGCGVLSAAKLLGESADITRFPRGGGPVRPPRGNRPPSAGVVGQPPPDAIASPGRATVKSTPRSTASR